MIRSGLLVDEELLVHGLSIQSCGGWLTALGFTTLLTHKKRDELTKGDQTDIMEGDLMET